MKRDWSTKKGTVNPNSFIEMNCTQCGKKIIRPRWYQKQLSIDNKGRGPFCSRQCGLIGRPVSDAQKLKVSKSQIGVSVLSRGRAGHEVSNETREKLSKSKRGVPHPQDYDVIVREMKLRGIKKYANMTRRPIPDAVYFKDGKMIAVEVEKEVWESGIRNKMKEYDGYHDKWDKVILVWYTLQGIRMKEWFLEKGVWTVV